MINNLMDLLRASTVKRFHIVNTARNQNLAEHQYNTAMIAGELASRIGYNSDGVVRVMVVALHHDAGEVRTGDIPSPVKKAMREKIGGAYDAALMEFEHPIMSMASEEILTIVKCADYIEAMFFLTEHRVGRHADAVLDGITANAMDYFDSCGAVGPLAAALWSSMQNTVYSE